MRVLSYIFLAIGAFALGYCATIFIGARIYQQREMREFMQPAPAIPSPTKSPELLGPGKTEPKNEPQQQPNLGSGIALLTIPSIGLKSVVVEGVDKHDLELGPGHIPGTSLPGAGGNIGIAGHRDTFFRPLRLIHKGDTITLTTREKELHYKVSSTKIVRPENVEVLNPTDSETLTLVTCFPFYYVGSAPERFIVRADCENCGT